MPGPLPNPQRRRRNTPTIPTTTLPASGRKGRPPACPYLLGDAGQEWWKWAWSRPQACAWSTGNLYTVARRAALEDEFAVASSQRSIAGLETIEASELFAWARALLGAVDKTRAEMLKLDVELGLTPKSMAALRWTIVDDTPDQATPAVPAAGAEPRRRLKVV